MRGIRLTSEDIADHIRHAGETCLLITPGVEAVVAEALKERAQHTATTASVVVDGSHHAERSGYGETSTWRTLIEVTELKASPGTRLGLLVTERGSWLFAPRAGKLDPREEGGFGAVELGAHSTAARTLFERIFGRRRPSPKKDEHPREGNGKEFQADRIPFEDEPRAQCESITKEELDLAERAIEEHPPRDYAREREITVYSSFVGYIELRLAGASLSKGTRLKIPNELVELGLAEDELRKRINESVMINIEDEVDTGVRGINERLKAIRTLYTRQLGEPHGRIYRKRQRLELEGHLEDLNREIAQANSALGDKIDTAIRRQLDHLAETYSRQMAQGTSSGLKKDDAIRLLLKAWHDTGAVRRREVKLEVTFKDLTWDSLQDQVLREQIVEQFPELKNSALYREYRAHTPSTSYG